MRISLIIYLALSTRTICHTLQDVIPWPDVALNGIPYNIRAHWMRQANNALSQLASPCPFGAFGTVIVNHTAPSKFGDLVCIGVNTSQRSGNPTHHGEMAAIENCTAILTDPKRYNLTTAQALTAFADLSLYTNAESCPMCASAIRWAGFREYIYGTSIDTLIEQGWGQIRVSSLEIFRQSFDLPTQSRLLGGVLANETDPYFKWQYNTAYPCPNGCRRTGKRCTPN